MPTSANCEPPLNMNSDNTQVWATFSPEATPIAPNDTPYAPVATPTPIAARSTLARSGVPRAGNRAASSGRPAPASLVMIAAYASRRA